MARLIDSSLWVDFTRSKSPPSLKALIHPWILDPEASLCEPIVFEVLRLATPAERPLIEAQFETLPLLATPPTLWRDATRLGQHCRDKGHTPGSLDLLIAAIALYYKAQLITFDEGFSPLATHTALRLKLLARPESP